MYRHNGDVPPPRQRTVPQTKYRHPNDASSPRQRTTAPDEIPSPRRNAITLTKLVTQTKNRPPDEVPPPERSPVTQTKYRHPNKARHPELDSGSVKAPPLCYKSFASGPVEGWSLHSQRSVKRLVEEPPLLCKQAHSTGSTNLTNQAEGSDSLF